MVGGMCIWVLKGFGGGKPTLTGSMPISSNFARRRSIRATVNLGPMRPARVIRGLKSAGPSLSVPATILLNIEFGGFTVIDCPIYRPVLLLSLSTSGLKLSTAYTHTIVGMDLRVLVQTIGDYKRMDLQWEKAQTDNSLFNLVLRA